MFKLTRLLKAGVFLITLTLFSFGAAYAQEELGTEHIGEASFQKNCAACHGMKGEGDGPFIEFLKQKPGDLTTIRQRIYAWIRDPEKIRAHGTEEMPIWGDRFNTEIIERYGPDYIGPGSSVHGRILELVFYIGTIQK